MYLFDLENSEENPHYKSLAISNGERQFGFLQSVISAAVMSGHQSLSQGQLEALNFHAIACLHRHAGVYRPIAVQILNASQEVVFNPIGPEGVAPLMAEFIEQTNSFWANADPILLAAFVLWRLNNIHPFVNGNGRTARAACYYVLCVRMGGLLPGKVFLPNLLKDSPDYRPSLVAADVSATAGNLDLGALINLIQTLLGQQLMSVAPPADISTPADLPPAAEPPPPADQ
ncbi:MAG: Fic family protein [Cypionkella sp.]